MPKLTDIQLMNKEPEKSILNLFAKIGYTKSLTTEQIQKNISIKNPDTLYKALLRLRRRKWIKQDGKRRYYKYFLTEKFFFEDIKRKIIFELELWDKDVFVDFVFNMKMKQEGFDNEPILWEKKSAWNLFGINQELFDALSVEDKKMLNNNMKNIVNSLEEIGEMKLKYINREAVKKSSKNMDLKTIHRLYNISFHYLGTPIYNVDMYKKEYLKIKSK